MEEQSPVTDSGHTNSLILTLTNRVDRLTIRVEQMETRLTAHELIAVDIKQDTKELLSLMTALKSTTTFLRFVGSAIKYLAMMAVAAATIWTFVRAIKLRYSTNTFW